MFDLAIHDELTNLLQARQGFLHIALDNSGDFFLRAHGVGGGLGKTSGASSPTGLVDQGAQFAMPAICSPPHGGDVISVDSISVTGTAGGGAILTA